MNLLTFIRGIIASFILFGCNSSISPEPKVQQIDKLISDSSSAEDVFMFDSLEKREILKRLFDNPNFDSLGIAIWKGNYSDMTSLNIPLSYDGKYHTSMDTIMYFTDTKKRECAVAIFSTYDYQPDHFDSLDIEPTGCHFCGVPIGAALFYQTEKTNWTLYDFKKEISQLGYFGRYKTGGRDAGKIELIEIGDKWTGLSLTQGPGGNGGYSDGGQSLFSIEQYNIDGSKNTSLTNILSNFYELKDSYLRNKGIPTLKTIKRQKAYFDIDVYQQQGDDIMKLKRFKYSTEYNRYIEESHK